VDGARTIKKLLIGKPRGREGGGEEYLDCCGRMMCENCSIMEPAVFGVLEGNRKAQLPPD